MMLRKLAVSLAVAGIMGVSNANALGLGEIKINSALNEPLNAEIKLLQVRKLSPLQIQPRMADVDEFALAGLDKSRFLTGVRFQVKVNPDGTGVIYISSDRPVREPFLNFLVELNWPNGRLVREYTLLLDPPVFDPTPVRQTVQPAAALPSPAKGPRSSSPKKEAVDNIRTRAAGNQQIYVDVKDTLWSIALKNKPNPSVSAKQLMIALQRKNPHAFIDNNINKLKAGVVLNMPSLAEIKALNDQQAAQEVVRQTSTWKSGSSTPAPVDTAKKPLETTKKSEQTKKAEQEKSAPEQTSDIAEKASAELKIVTPKESESKGNETTDQPADPAAVLDAEKEELAQRNIELETRLSESLENTDKIARENAELNERMDSIQYELEKLREMLELKDKEMAQLQDKVSAAPEAPVKPAPAPEEKGLLDKLMQSPLLLGGIGAGLLAVLAGLFFFLKRRKTDDEPAEEEESSLVQVPDDLDEADENSEADDISETEFETDDLEFDAEDQELLAEDENDLDDDDLSDLDDLDMDMDMDLDLDLEEETLDDSIEKVEQAESDEDEALLADDEFDLGLDEEDEGQPEDENADEDLVSEDGGLDDILGEAEEAEDELLDVASDDLDAILGDVQDEEDLEIDDSDLDSDNTELQVDDSDLDDILGDVQDDSELEVDDSVVDDSDLDDILGEIAEPEADEIDLDLDSDLEFNIEEPELGSELDESKEDDVIVDDSDDLEFEVAESTEAPSEEPEAVMDQMNADEVSEDALDALLDSVSDESPEVEELAVADSSAAAMDDDLEALLEESAVDVEEAPALEDVLVEESLAEEALVEDTQIEDTQIEETQVVEAPAVEPEAVEDALDLDGQDVDLGLDLEGGEEFESSPDIDELIAETATQVDLEEAQANETAVGDLDVESADDLDLDVSNDDLDAMLDEIGMDLDETDLSEDDDDSFKAKSSEELEAVIGHDLDAELDSLLSDADDEIELDESDDADLGLDEDFDELAGLNLLEGADEVETKLDLARAYLDMEDLDGAKDILQEVAAEGSDAQKQEAEALISSINEK